MFNYVNGKYEVNVSPAPTQLWWAIKACAHKTKVWSNKMCTFGIIVTHKRVIIMGKHMLDQTTLKLFYVFYEEINLRTLCIHEFYALRAIPWIN